MVPGKAVKGDRSCCSLRVLKSQPPQLGTVCLGDLGKVEQPGKPLTGGCQGQELSREGGLRSREG